MISHLDNNEAVLRPTKGAGKLVNPAASRERISWHWQYTQQDGHGARRPEQFSHLCVRTTGRPLRCRGRGRAHVRDHPERGRRRGRRDRARRARSCAPSASARRRRGACRAGARPGGQSTGCCFPGSRVCRARAGHGCAPARGHVISEGTGKGRAAHRHLDRLQVRVHLHVDACACTRSARSHEAAGACAPVMVPWMMDPFLSSTVTVSLLSFMRNLRGRRSASAQVPSSRAQRARTRAQGGGAHRMSFMMGGQALMRVRCKQI
jgi:hypothetical protein